MPRKLVSRATSHKICAAGNLIKKRAAQRHPTFRWWPSSFPLEFWREGGDGGMLMGLRVGFAGGGVKVVRAVKSFHGFYFPPTFFFLLFFSNESTIFGLYRVLVFSFFFLFFVCCLCDFGFALFLCHFSIRFASLRAHVRSTRWQHCQSVLPGLEKDDVWQFCPFTIFFFATISKVEIHP